VIEAVIERRSPGNLTNHNFGNNCAGRDDWLTD
jgi:hypothetical protein